MVKHEIMQGIPFFSWRYLLVGLSLVASIVIGGNIVPSLGVDTLILSLIGIGGLLIIIRPVVGLYFMVFTIPLTNLIVFEGVVTLTRVIGVIVFVAWMLHKVVNRESWSDVLASRLIKPGILFAIFVLSSLVWAENFSSGLDNALTIWMLLALSLVAASLINSYFRLEWVIRVLVVSGLVAASLTISQNVFLGVARAGADIGGNENHTATQLVVLLPIAFYLFNGTLSRFWKTIALIYIIMAPIAVLLTFSRVSFVVMGIVLLAQVLFFWNEGKRQSFLRLSLVGLIFFVTAYSFVPWDRVKERAATINQSFQGTEIKNSAVDSARGRFFLWQGAIVMFYDNPIIGVGIANFRNQILRYQFFVPAAANRPILVGPVSPHSTILGLLAELGIIGGILWAWLSFAAFLNLKRTWRLRELHFETLLIQALLISLTAYALYSIVSVTHNHKLFWLLIGLSEALRLMATKRSLVGS